jgi:pyruvate/2-oxoglutarate dehydrogenase complex dihydrolipoamide acyltransferase (E2) component
MPQMGVSVAEGTVAEWKKRVGDEVEADETIVEISTDKIETEIPSPATGRVAEILVEVGTTVDVGAVLARIDTGASNGEAQPEARPAAQGADGQRAAGDGHPPPISPVVRRIADEHGIDLSQVEGSGRRGRVTKKDLLAFLEQQGGAPAEPVLHMESPYREEEVPAAAPGGPPAPAVPAGNGARTQPAPPARGEELSVMRKQIAEHMTRSLRTAAHCTTVVEADMGRIDAARSRGTRKLSYLPFVCRAAIAALREHPRLNATMEGDRLTVHEAVHLGIAVSLGEEGLIVPVVHDAHELSHEGLAARIADLAERARTKRLEPDEVRGGTFTVTNPGAFGALLATPIINQPQVAILDLEAVVKRPVVVSGAEGDSIAIRPMTYLCMSWDHRALDGALAAQFLSTVLRNLEDWRG